MTLFNAAFKIVSERNCPFYIKEDIFQLTDKSVELPTGQPACLILLRELTGLLFRMMPEVGDDFPSFQGVTLPCGGCNGLIKFTLCEAPPTNLERVRRNDDSVMSGRLDAVSPGELLQVFHMHQKTGNLLLDLPGCAARVSFKEGAVIAARFADLDNQEAIYALLQEREGHFRFIPGLNESQNRMREIGDFMMILMEGLKRIDEDDV
jgi:hypothetical protein